MVYIRQKKAMSERNTAGISGILRILELDFHYDSYIHRGNRVSGALSMSTFSVSKQIAASRMERPVIRWGLAQCNCVLIKHANLGIETYTVEHHMIIKVEVMLLQLRPWKINPNNK